MLDQRADWQRYFLTSGMTHSLLIPGMLDELLDYLKQSNAPPSALDFHLMVGGGFMARSAAERALKYVSRFLENICASTETNLYQLRSKVASLNDLHWLCPIQERRVEIVDEFGGVCPDDVEGQLRVGLTDLDYFPYLDEPDATAKAFRNGYFYPGYMAVRRFDGRIRILGRSANVINVRGQKLAVAPMEYEVQTRLGVDAVCIFSGLNAMGEQEIMIAIGSQQPPGQSALMTLGCEFEQFDQVNFALLERFPRTQTGISKIDRIALRKLVFPDKTPGA